MGVGVMIKYVIIDWVRQVILQSSTHAHWKDCFKPILFCPENRGRSIYGLNFFKSSKTKKI